MNEFWVECQALTQSAEHDLEDIDIFDHEFEIEPFGIGSIASWVSRSLGTDP